MVHPLYHRACGLIGRTVLVYHRNGSVYQGTLAAVEPNGIYMVPQRTGARMMSYDKVNDGTASLLLSSDHHLSQSDLGHIYSPMSYFAFGALAGLGLGAMAGGMYW